jgi:hypothetical protein
MLKRLRCPDRNSVIGRIRYLLIIGDVIIPGPEKIDDTGLAYSDTDVSTKLYQMR